MKFGKLCLSLICVAVSIVLITQLYGCGTFIYPERRGQKGGTIDGAVFIMDALWLIVFIIPGVAALGVDFITGAIYFPGGSKRSSDPDDTGRMTVVRVDPRDLNEMKIKEIVMMQTGLKDIDMSRAKIYRLDDPGTLEKELARIARSGY
jgi:uncharacterized membrane protein